MSALGDVVTAIVAALDDAAVPATADPDTVAPTIAAHGVVAFVLPPEVESRVLGRGMRTLVEVNLLGAPPGGHADMLPVWELLGPAMDALTARQARVTTRTVGGVTYPGYQLAATPNTPC